MYNGAMYNSAKTISKGIEFGAVDSRCLNKA